MLVSRSDALLRGPAVEKCNAAPAMRTHPGACRRRTLAQYAESERPARL